MDSRSLFSNRVTNTDALSKNPIVNEEKSRNLHEDDDYTFMTSQGKMNLEKIFMKINQGNNIRKGNNSRSIVYYVPRRTMRVIVRLATMLAGDRSQGVVDAQVRRSRGVAET